MDSLAEAGKDHEPSNLRHHRRIFDKPVELLKSSGGHEWPMLSDEQPPFPPPEPPDDLLKAMYDESAHLHPSEDLGPIAKRWTRQLQEWYLKLQKHFGFDPADLPDNVYRSRHRWARRLNYLRTSNENLYNSIMSDTNEGHRIPFASTPKKFFGDLLDF